MTTSIRFRVATFGVAALLTLGAMPRGIAPTAHADDEPVPAPPETEAPAEEAAPDAPLPWETDYAAAQAKAKSEGKDLLINFTGSDWCHWCVRLDKEVFHKSEFAKPAGEQFVFVFMDFPRAAELKAKVVDVEQRDALQKRFGVQGFPTIMLAFADGSPYATTGYQEGGPAAYLEHITKLREKAAPARALAVKGDKASLEEIKAAVPLLADAGYLDDPSYKWVLDRIPQLDPDGKAGLLAIHAVYLDRLKVKTLMAELMADPTKQPDWDAVVVRLQALDAKNLRGTREEDNYVMLYYNAARWFVEEARHEEARSTVAMLLKHPAVVSNDRAQEALNELLEQIDQAEKGAAEEGTEEEPAEEEPAEEDAK